MTEHKSINASLRGFSQWFDDFLLEVAKPLAIVGFAMGTVDIFTRGGIATSPWFNVPWAIVQAVTIDGLFFAVWYRIASTKWTGAKIGLIGIGLVLAVVAMITNGILSLQQLQNISDSSTAMAWLGIDPITFTIGRAVLVVFVSIMVAFVYYQRENSVPTGVLAENSLGTAREQLRNTTVPAAEQWNTDWNHLVEVRDSLGTVWNNLGTPLFSTEQWTEHGGTIPEQPRTIVEQLEQSPGTVLLLAEQSGNSDQDKIREAMSARIKDHRPINLVEVAEETGLAYGRVRKLAPGIKKGLGV